MTVKHCYYVTRCDWLFDDLDQTCYVIVTRLSDDRRNPQYICTPKHLHQDSVTINSLTHMNSCGGEGVCYSLILRFKHMLILHTLFYADFRKKHNIIFRHTHTIQFQFSDNVL